MQDLESVGSTRIDLYRSMRPSIAPCGDDRVGQRGTPRTNGTLRLGELDFLTCQQPHASGRALVARAVGAGGSVSRPPFDDGSYRSA